MNNRVAAGFFAALFGLAWPGNPVCSAPAPLVVGSVRDQRGDPIAGASVRVPGPAGRGTLTLADGTFSLVGLNATSVTISCQYCRSATFPVTAGAPVVAAIHRYDALVNDGPSADDIAGLPYAHVESLLALRPFTVLEDSQGVVPGPRVSDRGLSSQGGLLLDADIPNYDIAANVSTFLTTPSFGAARVDFVPPSEAFRYGDLTGAGTFLSQLQTDNRYDAAIVGGSDAAFRFSEANDTSALGTSLSRTSLESRRRLDAGATFSLNGDALDVAASAARGSLQTDFGSGITQSFSGVRAAYERRREQLFHALLTADRGSYGAARQYKPFDAGWSDVSAQAGVATLGPSEAFLDAGIRSSAGFYDAGRLGIPRIAATLSQARAAAGFKLSRGWYDITAGIGAFHTRYNGGIFGFAQPMRADIVTPSLRVELWRGARVHADATLGTTFRLPTFLEAYGFGPDEETLIFDRQLLQMVTITYADYTRFHASVTAARERVSGLDNGTITAAGLALSWQIAPEISVRAWDMRVDDESRPYARLPRFGAVPRPVSVGSAWLTFENDAAFRADLIYRSDLVDYQPDRHVDAALSAPLGRGLRWYLGTERRHFARYVDVGIHFVR